jgi:hypothetical protein
MHQSTLGLFVAVSLVAAAPAAAKSHKYTSEIIGAQKTCKSGDPSAPVDKCIKAFADKFCKDKGHKTYVMANWKSSGNGYSDPTLIYCK